MWDSLHAIALRLIEWWTRRPIVGLRLVWAGAAIIVATLGVDILGELDYQDGTRRFSLKLSTSGGLPQQAMWFAYGVGVLILLSGLVITIYHTFSEARHNARKRAYIVEIRGLHASPDTPAKDADLKGLPTFRESVRLDFRPKSEAELVDPVLALQKVSGMKAHLQTFADGRDPSDVAVAVGGLAAVPALFLAGLLLDDESAITIFDWDRETKRWRLFDGPDDGRRLLPWDFGTLPSGTSEVVLLASLSYSVNDAAVQAAFPSTPLVHVRANGGAPDKFWSLAKQQAVAAQFRQVIQELMQKGVGRIHLVLAAPAGLSIRLGMTYDRRLMPELLVYQYERSATPAYPWAFLMPTHGKHQAELVWNKP